MFANAPELQLPEHKAFDPDPVNRPRLAAIFGYQVTRSACCALGSCIVGIGNVHDDLGVDVLVSRVGTTGGVLAFGRSAPPLSETGVYTRRQLRLDHPEYNR